MLHIQKYMRSGKTTDDLHNEFAIKAKRHNKYNNLVLFKYSQIESPFSEEIVRECRGIILDEANDWKIVARAFNKFFNYGEGHAVDIDWRIAKVQEKKDGSLCLLYSYNGDWHVSTTGTPDASGDINGLGKTFAELFWETWGDNQLPVSDNHCYYFELCGPLNRVVVQHEQSHLTLLGARDLETQRELTTTQAHELLCLEYEGSGGKGFNILPVKEYNLSSYESIAASFKDLSPLKHEGYVIIGGYSPNGSLDRVKDKNPAYIALHHAKDGMQSRKSFIEIARSGEISEVITAFPEFKVMLDETKVRYEALVAEVEADYERLKDIVVQKDFAVEAVKTKCPSALFNVRAKRANSVREFLSVFRIDNLLSLLGYRDIEVPPVQPDRKIYMGSMELK